MNGHDMGDKILGILTGYGYLEIGEIEYLDDVSAVIEVSDDYGKRFHVTVSEVGK